jgi:hypothetical protein
MIGSADGAALAELAARLAEHDRDGNYRVLLDGAAHQRALDLYAGAAGAGPDTLTVLGRWFLSRFEYTGGPADLRAARACAALLRDAGTAALPPEFAGLLGAGADLTARTSDTARVLLDRFDDSGDQQDLQAAAELVGALTAALPAGAEPPLEVLWATSRLAFGRYTAHADGAELDTMVLASRALLARAEGPVPVHELARGLLLRFEVSGAGADLDEAQGLLEPYAVDPAEPTYPATAALLANVLRARFERTLDTAGLDRAVELTGAALARLPAADPERQNALEVRLMCLARRYVHLDDDRDLATAIECAEQLKATSDRAGGARGGRGRAVALWGLATLLGLRALRSEDTADLDAALRLTAEAMAPAANVAVARHSVLARHGNLLTVRFLVGGDRADLTAAIDHLRRALAATPETAVYRTTYRAGLALLLTLEADATGRTDRLTEALDLARAAVRDAPLGHPQRVDAMLTLAEMYSRRYARHGDLADIRAAVALRRIASASPAGTMHDRMRATAYWLGTALRLDDMRDAAEAAATGVALLPAVVRRGVHRLGQERRLARVTGLPGVAAALALAQGQPERAVELIEQGRTVLWAQVAQLRGDLSGLAAVDPALAAELDRTRQELAAVETGQSRTRYRAVAARWEELLARARALPGFATFLGTTPFGELRAAAGDGSVVIVNVAGGRSDALVVHSGGVRLVPLPWLALAACQQRAQALLAAVTEAERQPDGPLWTNLRQTLGSLLRWLWDVVAAPVLAALDELAGPVRHRVWWCPTGPLTLLPLHAAGRYGAAERWAGRRRPSVPDRTVSSYTTGLGALLRARLPAPGAGAPSLLAVGLPHTPGRASLPAVTAELDRVAAMLPGTRRLTGQAATPEAVLAELDRHRWLHLACHATQQVDRPGDSALHLHGGDLSALRLASRHLAGAELAYLSACHTASGSMALADEAVHLAAALQLAGYRHVIGTLWGVSDGHAAAVAGVVYAALTAGGRPDAGGAAAALAAATGSLRARHPDRPDLWASFVHFGP